MDLTIAAAYMEVTNEALRRNAETSVIVHKTKLIEEDTKRLKAEGERLKAEGEAIKAQGERNRTHKKLRAYYKERHQKYPVEKQRIYHAFLMKTKLKDRIDAVLSGHVIKESSNETYDLIFSLDNNSTDKPITNALLQTAKAPKKA